MTTTDLPLLDLTPFTPTERRIVALLSDGFAHTHVEVKGLLLDELAADAAVKVHVSRIRAKLPPHLGIFYDATNGTNKWRMVRFIGYPSE